MPVINSKNKVNTPIDLHELINIHGGAIDYFNKLHERGTENERYYSADPFDEKQKQEYALQDRIPFSISTIPKVLNQIISSEKQQRVSAKAKVRVEPEDISDDPQQRQQLFLKEIKAKLATLRLKTIEQENSGQYNMSDIFASGIAVIYGYAKLVANVNKYGDPQIEIHNGDYKNLIWDVNSTEYERNDVQWIAEKKYKYRIDLKQKHGNDVAGLLSIGDAAARWGRKKTQYFVNYNKDGNSDLDLLTVFEHYHKVNRNYYTVLFNGQIVGFERRKSDAEDILRRLQRPYFLDGTMLPPADIIKTPRQMFDKYEFTYTDMLSYEETDWETHPYSIYQAFQFKDKIWCMTDVLKSMQQFANRLLAQIDYAFGVDLKNKYEIYLPALEGTGYSIEEAMNLLDKKGYIPTMVQGLMVPIKSQGANPQWAQIMELMLKLINETSGGTPFTGSPSYSGQSGKAIQTLVNQGSLLVSSFIDNRNRFLDDFYKKMLYFMEKYDNAPYIMRVEGGALSPEMIQLLEQEKMFAQSIESKNTGYVRMNENNQNYLQNSEYDLEIVEESLSDSKKEAEFGLMTQMEQADPELKLSSTWREKKLSKISSLTYDERAKIKEEIEQAQQAQQQQIQAQEQEKANIEKAKILISDKGQIVNNNENDSNNRQKKDRNSD